MIVARPAQTTWSNRLPRRDSSPRRWIPGGWLRLVPGLRPSAPRAYSSERIMMESRRRFSRRRDTRVRVDWPARWTFDGVEYEGVVRDTTGTGLFLQPNDQSAKLPGKREQLDLRLEIPESGILDTTGIVTWSGHSRVHDCVGIGIKFFARHVEIGEQAERSSSNVPDRRKDPA